MLLKEVGEDDWNETAYIRTALWQHYGIGLGTETTGRGSSGVALCA